MVRRDFGGQQVGSGPQAGELVGVFEETKHGVGDKVDRRLLAGREEVGGDADDTKTAAVITVILLEMVTYASGSIE